MFRLFKRKKEPRVGMTWYDVTLDQFQRLKGLDMTDLDNQIEAAGILLGEDVDSMTWKGFCQEVGRLEFLNEPIPQTIIRKTYTLNGRVYDVKANLNDLTVSRYMDFVNQCKTGKWERILSVVLIPQGKDYGDYDIDQVYEDIKTMNIVEANGVFSFFKVQFIVCTKTMKDFSVKALKGNPELQRLVLEAMESCSMSDLL